MTSKEAETMINFYTLPDSITEFNRDKNVLTIAGQTMTIEHSEFYFALSPPGAMWNG